MYNCRDQRPFFRGVFKKLILLVWTLWISSINSVRNLQILDFSRKNKKIKNVKNGKKSLVVSPVIHTTNSPVWLLFDFWSPIKITIYHQTINASKVWITLIFVHYPCILALIIRWINCFPKSFEDIFLFKRKFTHI